MIFFKEAKKEYLVILAMSVSVTFSGSLIAPIEQRFISTLTGNNILMGFAFMVGTLSIAVISLAFAKLARTYGTNKMIILGAALGIIYPIIYATSNNIFQFIGGKIVYGASGAVMGPLLLAYLQDHLSSSENKGKLIGYLYSMQSVAGSIGAVFGGILADKYFLGSPFYAQAAILLVPFLLSIKFLRREKKIENRPAENYSFIIKYILSKPYLIYHLILEIPFQLNWAVKVVLYPLIIISFVNSNTITGSVIATQGIVAMLVLVFSGKLVDKYSYMFGMKSAFLILAFASSMMALSNNLPIFWLFAGLFAAGEAINGPAKGVLQIVNIENQYRAQVIAVFSILEFFVQALSPFLAGILLVFLAPQAVLLSYSAITWLFLGLATIVLSTNLKKQVK